MTPLFTIFLVSFGFSSCSHIATRWPAFTSLCKYVSNEWYGNPANLVSEFDPAPLLVKIIPKTFDAIIAS